MLGERGWTRAILPRETTTEVVFLFILESGRRGQGVEVEVEREKKLQRRPSRNQGKEGVFRLDIKNKQAN